MSHPPPPPFLARPILMHAQKERLIETSETRVNNYRRRSKKQRAQKSSKSQNIGARKKFKPSSGVEKMELSRLNENLFSGK
jgi:hypothetical protein